jgi:hypothetical protein
MSIVDPRAEAQRVVGDRYDVRVLEPSPPAVRGEPFSDDPTARGDVEPGKALLTPVTNGDLTWEDLCRRDPSVEAWCAERWLAAWPPLRAIADAGAYAASLDAWHTVGERVVANARFRANGKIGLRWTRDGFGTPYFGRDAQVRVEGRDIVRVDAANETVERAPITTLAAAAAFAGVEPAAPDVYTATTDDDVARPLHVDADAAARLADWYGFATSVLAQLRVDYAAASPSLVQLWPEHFDVSTDWDDVAYGASPGDAAHSEPYLYLSVGPDRLDRADAYWNEPFGASFAYADVLGATDQRDAALAFFRAGAGRLGHEPR